MVSGMKTLHIVNTCEECGQSFCMHCSDALEQILFCSRGCENANGEEAQTND